ncbi:Cation/H(+) antiporter 28 [Rhynchospora pubera]|uniref:Cation/H(+) antiporter 28 n=1 Tax=Rhynchospora pubera TaxID=906938 RepID=A0AAV8CJF5_9POAL|nr:Cation/H(+) antiporter 28 [Rhynchospora pubera]
MSATQASFAPPVDVPVKAEDFVHNTCIKTGILVSATYESMAIQIVIIVFFGKLLHLGLRRLFIPRLVSDMIVAITVAKVDFIRSNFESRFALFFKRFGDYMFSTYLFTLGLGMDPFSVFNRPGKDHYIAYAGVISTVAITLLCKDFLVKHKVGLIAKTSIRANLGFGAALAGTGSPLLTRLITEQKLSKTAVGQAAVRAGIFSDMIVTSFMCIGDLIFHDDSKLGDSAQRNHKFYVAGILAEIITLMVVSKWVLDKINECNPEGKPMKGIYITGLMVAVLCLCFSASFLHMDLNLAAFMIGLALPREGRATQLLINNLNFFLNCVILPLYLVYVSLSIRHSELRTNPEIDRVIDMPLRWHKLLITVAIGTVGKIFGTVTVGLFFGMKWLDAIALGQLLSIKGYYHIFCANEAWEHFMINDTTFVAMLWMITITSAITPLVAYGIAEWKRCKARSQLMALQFHKSGTELQIMVGLQGPQNLPIAFTLVEAIGWTKEPGKLTMYSIDMIELTERAAATLVRGQGAEAVEVTDAEVMDVRNEIGEALEAFRKENNDGVNVKRLQAISSFDDMDRDICMCAKDVMAVLILIPFHKCQRMDGPMDIGHAGFRLVNQKVLQHAPCSVGIIIDRGFGHMNQTSLSLVGKNVVVVFIGGGDDREALTLAAEISQHPAIKLTVVRFLPAVETRGNATTQSRTFHKLNQSFTSDAEIQMQLDDEFFADFYRLHIINKGVEYMEKHVADAEELVMELHALESQYELFVVGKGRDRKSVLTDGLEDWTEYPELGHVGDIIASSEFSTTASVLVIQQYDARKNYDVIDDEFRPF